MAELFGRSTKTINEHLKNLYAEEELDAEATIRKIRIVRIEGSREVVRAIEHYNLEAILAVGFRVKSPRGTQFRKWANTRLRPHARTAVQDVKRTGKSVLLYITPRVRENGFSYAFAFPCSAGCAGWETDWKVRSPLHHSEGTGERVFLPVCFPMLGGLCRA